MLDHVTIFACLSHYRNLTAGMENREAGDPDPTEMWPFYYDVQEILNLDFTGMEFSDLEDGDYHDGDGYHRKPKNERGQCFPSTYMH